MDVVLACSGLVLGAVVLLLVGPTSSRAAAYYLSPDGDDGNLGGRDAPWKSIGKANTTLAPGDTAIFLPGTYSGTIAPVRGGKRENAVCYRSEDRQDAQLTGGGDTGLAIDIQKLSYVTVEGFRISPGEGLWLRAEGSDHLTVRDCHMEKSGQSTPLIVKACRHVCLLDNTFRKDRVTGNMCQVIDCTFVVFEGNALSHVGHSPLQISTSNRVVVRANCFHNPWGRNYEFWASARMLVEGNVVTEALDSAHSADSKAKNLVTESIIRHNRAFRNWHTPLTAGSYVPRGYYVKDPFRMVNSRVYHNTITGNLGYGWEIGGVNISSNVFVNNLFCGNDPYGEGVQLSVRKEICRDNLFLSNVFHGTEPGQKTVQYGDRFWTTEEAGEEGAIFSHRREFEGNLDVDPGFIDPGNHDFRLHGDSPCIDAGRPLTRATDGGRGRRLPVTDGMYFYDGFGVEGERGDWIAVGKGDRVARVESVELNYYQADILVLDRDLEWEEDAPVSLPWSGKAPDIGAYECGPTSAPRSLARAEPAEAQPGGEIRLRAEALGTEIEDAIWSFGDGTTARGMEVTHRYEEAGGYPVRARLRYSGGDQGVEAAYVKVAERADPADPMLRVDFEEETRLEWGSRFKIYRGNRSVGHDFVDGGYEGRKCVHVYAEADGSDLSCALAPREWDIDAYPFIRFAYRIPEGTPVGLWLQPFPTERYGLGIVMVGGTSARDSGAHPDTGTYALIDDGEWHDITIDVRTVREERPDLRYLRVFRFYTHLNANEGQGYWFDAFSILPGGV